MFLLRTVPLALLLGGAALRAEEPQTPSPPPTDPWESLFTDGNARLPPEELQSLFQTRVLPALRQGNLERTQLRALLRFMERQDLGLDALNPVLEEGDAATSPQTLLALAHALYVQGALDAAQRFAQAAHERAPSEESTFMAVRIARRQGNWDDVLRYAPPAPSGITDDRNLCRIVLSAHLERGALSDAVTYASRCQAVFGDRAPLWSLAAYQEFARKKHWAEAELYFQAASQQLLARDQAEVYGSGLLSSGVKLQLEQGQPERAAEVCFASLLFATPHELTNQTALRELRRIALVHPDFALPLDTWEARLKAESRWTSATRDTFQSWRRLGGSPRREGRTRTPPAESRRAPREDLEKLVLAKNWTELEAATRTALRRYPQDLAMIRYLARALEEQGRTADTLAWLERSYLALDDANTRQHLVRDIHRLREKEEGADAAKAFLREAKPDTSDSSLRQWLAEQLR